MTAASTSPVAALVARFDQHLNTLLHASAGPARLCVAYSGGMDSTVLLHLLAQCASRVGVSVSAVHVHHGLSPYAGAWATHCGDVCAALGVPLRVARVQVCDVHGKGLEAAARAARHAVLAQEDADWIVLAHHADDQAETLLHRLLRGTGVAGAAAMRERDPGRRLWRPLLAESRAVLDAWAREQGLRWIEDDSNGDESLTRNYLRHSILSPLRGRFPAAIDNLARATRHFAEADELLDELARNDDAVVLPGQAGARTRLQALSDARLRNLLRYWIVGAGVQAPSTVRLEELLNGLRGDQAVHWQHAGLAVCGYRHEVWCEEADLGMPTSARWRGEASLPWGRGNVVFVHAEGPDALRIDPARDRVEVRIRQGGERMRLAPGRHSRALRLLCQELGVPPWWRSALPLLWVNDELVWAAELGVAAGWRAEPGQAGWRVTWQRPGVQASEASSSLPMGSCR